MADRHWYDKDGNYRGRSSDTSPFMEFILGAAALVAIAWLLFSWIWKTLNGYSDYALPYNIIAGYYYYLIVFPLNGATWVFSAITTPGITQYKNLNAVIAAVLSFSTVALPFAGAFLLVRRNQMQRFVPAILGGPLAVAVLWALVSASISWLLS